MADPIVRVVRDYGERCASLDVGRRQRHGAFFRSAGGGRAARGARGRAVHWLAGTRGDGAAQGTTPGAAGAPYQSIEVVSPAEQETLWNIGTNLPVQVRFQPSLQPGHRYDLLFDGQRRNVNTATPRVTLPDVYRGEHTLQVVVIDSDGTELMRSPSRVFFVQQTSTQNPNRGAN